MAIINLRDYYPFYTSDCFMEVSEEVAEMFKEFDRKEAAYRLRTYRHKAYYSLDRDDGLEHEAVFVALSPHELYERKVTMQELHAAIASLPDKQAKRIYAHFILGMTKQDIARAEVRRIDKKELRFICLSGIATGASWICYYQALQEGPASVVTPIDKLSVIVTVVFSYFVFGEKLSKKAMAGLALLTVGIVAMAVI